MHVEDSKVGAARALFLECLAAVTVVLSNKNSHKETPCSKRDAAMQSLSDKEYLSRSIVVSSILEVSANSLMTKVTLIDAFTEASYVSATRL
jgi:hypothetical protein